MHRQQALGLLVALADDLPDLGIDGFGGILAKWLRGAVTAGAAKVGVLPRRKLD